MYYFIYFIFYIFCILELNFKTSRFLFFSLFIIILLFITSFRGDVGTDYKEYINFWNGLHPINSFDLTYYTNFEIFYKIIFSLVKVVTNSELIFLFVNACLVFIPLSFALKNALDRFYTLSLLIYYSVFFMPYTLNGMRQAIAMSIFLYSLKYFNSNRLLPILILTIIASCIHSTGYLIIVIYFLFLILKKVKLWFYPVSFVISIVIYKFNILTNFIFNNSIVNKEVYAEKYDENTSALQILTRVLLVIFLFYFSYINRYRDEKLMPLFNIYWIGFLLYLTLMNNNLMATRFNMFFRVLEVILLPLILLCFKDKFNRNFVFFIIFLYYIVVFYISSLAPDYTYFFYWE